MDVVFATPPGENTTERLTATGCFFCCNICADIFETMIRKVKEATGWNKIDYVELKGNYSIGRNCVAKNGKEEFKYYFRTYGDGTFISFEKR